MVQKFYQSNAYELCKYYQTKNESICLIVNVSPIENFLIELKNPTVGYISNRFFTVVINIFFFDEIEFKILNLSINIFSGTEK